MIPIKIAKSSPRKSNATAIITPSIKLTIS